MGDVAQMAQVIELQLAQSMKRLESHFRFKGAKTSNKMKKALEAYNIGTHREVAKCVATLSNHLANVCKVESNFAHVSGGLADRKTLPDGPATVNE